MKPEIEFWYEFASTYSYLTVMRIGELSRKEGVDVIWRPFLLGPIFKNQGWDTSPFNIYESKGRYMWRDIERLAQGYGFSWRRPTQFPRNGVKASRLALVAQKEGWCEDFTKKVFEANFELDQDISDELVLGFIIESLGQSPDRVIELAKSDDFKHVLRTQTELAMEKGVFGAPTFFSGDEMFWGNDRLEHAIGWAKKTAQTLE